MKKLYKKTKILQKTIYNYLNLWYYYYSDISLERNGKKMELENIKKIIKDLEANGFDIFYIKGNDTDSIKLYEDNKLVVFVNYNYGYVDIISK